MIKNSLFFIGGAKGVGKTKLTSEVASDLKLKRIETGIIVFDYVHKGLPLEGLTERITSEILSYHESLILDTHYARYSDKEESNKQFMRGLESKDIKRLLGNFNIFPCLIEVDPFELEQRRKRDNKTRVTNLDYIIQEIEFNRTGYELYLKDTQKPPFVLINNFYLKARNELSDWIINCGF